MSFHGIKQLCKLVAAWLKLVVFVGLNLMSQFHLDNVTVYNTKSEEYDQARKLVSLLKQCGMLF